MREDPDVRWWRRDRVVALVVGVVAAVASLIVTRDGVGIDADSAAYLGAAQNLRDGHGVSVPFTLFTDELRPSDAARLQGAVPLTHFPPLYPAAVAAVPGVDVEDAARLLGAALLGLNLALVTVLATRLVRNPVTRALAVALAAFGPTAPEPLAALPSRTALVTHGQAMSESLFVTAVLLTLLAATSAAPRAWHLAVPAAAAVATRYVGVAVVLVAAIAFALHRRRLRSGVGLAVIAMAPVVAVEVAIGWIGGGASPRSLHWPNRAPTGLTDVVEGWLGLADRGPVLRHVALAVVVVVVLAALVRTRDRAAELVGACIVLYALVVAVTRATVDASTPLDARMFSPVQGPFYVLVIGTIGAAAAPYVARLRDARAAVLGFGIGLPLGLALSAVPDAWRTVADGLPERRQPLHVVDAVDDLPPDALIATNVPTQVWEATRRGSILVPLRTVTVTGEPNRRFEAEVAELAAVVCADRGYVVLVSPRAGGFGTFRQATAGELLAHPPLRVLRELDDGVILGVGPARGFGGGRSLVGKGRCSAAS
jgi:hypothetical protein